MSKKSGLLSKLVYATAWLTGIIVSLAVGFGMIGEALTVPWFSPIVSVAAGWIVVVLTVLGAILAIFDSL